MRWTGNVVGKGETRNAYIIYVRKMNFGKPKRRWE
jgi:hypothetical protein